jgi:predicted permease
VEHQAGLSTRDGSRSVFVTSVDSDLFNTLAVSPQVGALPTSHDLSIDASVAVISDRLWRSLFRTEPDVIGQSLRIDGREYRVSAVMPPTFRFYLRSDVYVPIDPAMLDPTSAHRVSLVGRLRSGVSAGQATQETILISRRLASIDSTYKKVSVVTQRALYDRPTLAAGPIVTLLLSCPLLVLLLACANVAMLLTSRLAARQAEITVRSALGASPRRIASLIAAEVGTLGVMAIATGLIVATLEIHAIEAAVPDTLPSWFQIAMDWKAFGVVVGVTLGALGAFCLAVAWRSGRGALSDALRGLSGGTIDVRTLRRLGSAVRLQLAMSLAVAVGLAMVLLSIGSVARIDRGYPARELLRLNVLFDSSRYASAAQRAELLRRIGSRLVNERLVSEFAVQGNVLHLTADDARVRASRLREVDARLRRVAKPLDIVADSRPVPALVAVDTTFFSAFGLKIIGGRTLRGSDDVGSAPVVVLSESLARNMWPTGSPLGQLVRIGQYGTPATVVGVASDRREVFGNIRGMWVGGEPVAYYPRGQAVTAYEQLLLRGPRDARTARESVLRAVRAEDADAPVDMLRTLAEEQEESTGRLLWTVASVLGALALGSITLALLGLYGVMGQAVAARRTELAVRMALGASSRDVFRLMLRSGLGAVGAGVGWGLIGAVLVAFAMQPVLIRGAATNPIAYAGTSVLFGAIALFAVIPPTRRSSRLQPMVALRSD